MTTKHTPEPWINHDSMIDDAEGRTVATTNGFGRPQGTDSANAARIVACVNGCEGINPEAVHELVAAVDAVLEVLPQPPRVHAHLAGPLGVLRAAIAKAKVQS